MSERAIATPFDSGEICEIAVEEFRARLRNLSPLQGGKEYSHFRLKFSVEMELHRAGEDENLGKMTLAWGDVTHGQAVDGDLVETAVIEDSIFESREPNVERLARDMPLTVESGDGKGGKVLRKVRIKA
jgi:hypothetical protein